MRDDERRYQQESIIAALGVPARFDALAEVERRVGLLVEQLSKTRTRGYVLGISGGVDSSTAGRLCQLAVERVRHGGGQALFIAMRLPYGVQTDEADAQRALAFIRPDAVVTVTSRQRPTRSPRRSERPRESPRLAPRMRASRSAISRPANA